VQIFRGPRSVFFCYKEEDVVHIGGIASGATIQLPRLQLRDSQNEEQAMAKIKGKRLNGSVDSGNAAIGAVTPEERRRMIAEAAYYRAEKRGFKGDAMTDWLEAEEEINGLLLNPVSSATERDAAGTMKAAIASGSTGAARHARRPE
jgi:hypothetical protein